MYCKNCGNEISDNAFVCPKCGVKAKVKEDTFNDLFLGLEKYPLLSCLSILPSFFCCQISPFGYIAMYFIYKAGLYDKLGDVESSRNSYSTANIFSIINIVFIVLFYIILILLSIFGEMIDETQL